MEQSLLAALIRTLIPEEKTQILHFAAAGIFNNGRMKAQVIPLLDIFLNHPWDFCEQRMEKKEVFAKVFSNQAFVEGKLEKLMVEAHRVVKAFLIAQRYFREDNEFNQLIDYSEELRVRGLDKIYRQTLARLQKSQDTAFQHSQQFYHRQFLLEYSKYEEETRHNQAKGDLNIPNTLQALEQDYLHNRLVLLNQFLLQQKIALLNVPKNISLLLEENHIPKSCLEESVSIKINHEIFNLLRKNAPAASEVQHLFELLLQNEKSLDPRSLSDFYAFLRNLCVLSISSDYEKLEMAHMLHDLYKDNLDRGYLHSEGKISRSKYMAVANNALLIEKYDWALAFIEKHKNELQDENETKDIYRLNLATYLFKVGRFSDCLDNIPDTSLYLFYLLQAKRLELKALYELRSDLLPYKLDAFKMFLSRTSKKLLSDNQRQIHSDFANLLHQLVHSIPGDTKRSLILTKRTQEKKQAAEWRWLLEKAKTLKNG